jgi:hypothetical protein
MNFVVVIIFLVVWLLCLWIGAVALERTGLERSSARFQALSALSGTGFTTSQAEKVINHPTRRRIISFLIILGNTGSVTFIVLIVMALRSGVYRPAVLIGFLVLLIIPLAMLVSRLGLVTWITNLAAGSAQSGMVAQTWYQGGGYSLVEMRLGPNHALVGKSLKQMDSEFQVLFIERSDGVWAKPTSDDVLRIGDRILCYGPSTNHLIKGTGA